MTELTIDELFTPVDADGWETTMLGLADTVELKTTSWEPGSPTLSIIEITSSMFSQEDGIISIIAQGGFLDFAAGGSVTYTAANGETVTQAVSPDPSDPVANPTGAPTWLDVLGTSVYDTARLQPTFATGSLAVGITSVSPLNYAVGTYHVENPTTGATYKNAAAMTLSQGSLIGTAITAVTNASPPVVTTSTAHGITDGTSVVISGILGMKLEGVFTVTVVTATSFRLNGADTTGSGTYVSGGTVRATSLITIVADVSGSKGTSVAGAINTAVTTNPGVFVANPVAIVGSDFETNAQYARRCRAKLASLSPNGPKGAYEYFALSAADILGNSANPLFTAPAVTIPTITRVARSRDPSTGVVSVVVASADGAVDGVTNLRITGVSSTTPIQVTTEAPHGLSTGDPVTIAGVLGATTANGTWSATVIDAVTISLDGSVGGALYTGGGALDGGVLGEVHRVIQAYAVPDTVTEQTSSAVNVNVAIVATVEVPVGQVANYTAAVQIALALFNAAVPIGGVDEGVYPIDSVIGVLYAAGIVGGTKTSYVRRISGVTLNGANEDVPFGAPFFVASLTPAPVINVVGV